MPQTRDHDPATLRRLLEGAYERMERLEDERDRARGDLQLLRDDHTRLTAELKSERDAAETEAQQAKSRGDRLAGVVRSIVNNPTSQRSDVQGKLIVALEVWDGRRP